MAMSSKFDLSSGSPERALYTSGQRGAHLAAQLDRSGSFREPMENQLLSSLPSVSRSSTVVAQGDVSNFLQCLRFDPKVVAADHKSSHQGDFKRHINVALGISADESPTVFSKGKLLPSPIPEEIKRVKAGLRDSFAKARERAKTFNEALSVFNKFFPSIRPKKRSRSESFSNDRSSALLSSDRSFLGPTIGKMGMHNHSIAGELEFEQQKSEERPKSAVPNKRTRTSLVDVKMDMRNNALVRQPGNADREREMLRVSNSGAVQGEDRTLSVGVDGWEKAKMKKKRSGIKPDVSPSMVSTKPVEGYRESKQGIQQRAASAARTRLNNDSHGIRSGIANGSVGVGKPEGISQPTGLGSRSSVPRTDLDNGSPLNDRRDRPVASDKERVNIRAVNKMSVRDEFNSASPTSSSKMNASIRGPRLGSGVAPKLSPVVHRATASNDWELSHCTNKPTTAGGTNNRKRTTSARSASPPVTHWANQRPQKSSRTARRTNLVPIVSSTDETPPLDTASDMAGNEIGLGFARRLSSSSPQQVKLKGDALSSAALSESEESGAAEIKSKEKVKLSDEIDEKAGQNVQKVSTLVLPSRKNKLMTGEDNGDGVRRQGRTGRGITSTRSLMPMTVEKFGNVGTAKQLRSARLGLDKAERAGRPPTRKLTDRKAYSRQKHAATNAAADLLVGSEDGHEELVAAVNVLISSAHAFPNSFWRQMEPFLRFISDADVAYLKQQGNCELSKLGSTPVPSITDGFSIISSGCGLLEHERDGRITAVMSTDEVLSEQLVLDTRDNNVISLCQRFIAALIPEEVSDSGNGDLLFDVYGSGFEMDGELGSNGLSHIVNFQSTGHPSLNGYRISGMPEHDDSEIDMLGNTGINSNFCHSLNGTFGDQPMPGLVCSEFQYDSMKMNDKLLLEAQSIGVFLEPLPDIASTEDDEIRAEIRKLEEKHNEQVSKKKGLIDKLLEAATEARTIQEKEFEKRAHDKLVTMAYEKYMTSWGRNATGGKSSSNKMIKQAALVFVKRTLDQYHKFEKTGKSCFDEPMLRDMFRSGYSWLNGAQSVDTPTDGESGKPCVNGSTRSLEARSSGQNGDSNAINSSDLLPPNQLSHQTAVKDDLWSNRVKKRELLLEDVVGGTIGISSAQSGIGSSLSSSTKGKRSERDREGKGHGREALSRSGTTKIGRPVSKVKGERKSKAKPKQKTTQLSVSVNGLLGKMSEQPKNSPSVSKSCDIIANNNAKEKDEFGLDVLDDLQLPGQDLGSWLNIDDDGLQDHDFMGLEIPMDDLSDLNMMV